MHLWHQADTQIPSETKTGHVGCWLKQHGTVRRLVVRLFSLSHHHFGIYLLTFISFVLIVPVYSILRHWLSFFYPVANLRIKFETPAKEPPAWTTCFYCFHNKFNLGYRQTVLSPVLWNIITTYKATFMQEPFQQSFLRTWSRRRFEFRMHLPSEGKD